MKTQVINTPEAPLKISVFDRNTQKWLNEETANYIYDAICAKWFMVVEGRLTNGNNDDMLVAVRHTGCVNKLGKPIKEGDMYSEEIEESDGDTVLNTICVWIKELATFVMLSEGELYDYQDNGIANFDEIMRFSYMMDECDFKKRIFRGNIISNPELI